MKNILYQESIVEFKRIFHIMKITILALFIFVGTVFSTESYSQVMKVTVVSNNISTAQVINEIEKQTDYLFVFNVNEVNLERVVQVNAQNKSVAEVLNEVFEGTNVYYAMEGKNIMLMKADKKQTPQQAPRVTGIVKDNTGEPIIGVNVIIKGTSNGTITDANGNFFLSNVKGTDVLVFSYIGYVSHEINVGNRSQFNVTLAEDSETLDEVVVIGYGTVKRRDLTGSVASVSGDRLLKNPVSNVAEALQGQLPGVSVTSQDGRPGGSISIRVRGGNSITQSNDPLFIVDGVQVSNIDDIPADNIESIDVLKDAASTAIYGARGANGVIMITTKSSKEAKTTVSYNMYYQVKTTPDYIDVLDAYDYVKYTWAYGTALGYGDKVAQYFGLGSNYGNHLNEYKEMSSHNYMKDVMQTVGSWNHDISLSGGTEKTKYYASVNYTDDEGTRINSGFRRWNANVKVNQKINKSLSFNVDLRYNETELEGSRYDKATGAYRFRPINTPLGDDNPGLMMQGEKNVSTYYNPVDIINNNTSVTKSQRIRAKGDLTWEIMKGLTAKTELSLSRHWGEGKVWEDVLENGYSTASLTKNDGYDVRWATTLNYQVQGLKEAHSLSFLLGHEVLSNKSNSSNMTGAGYPEGFTMDDAFGMINMTDGKLALDRFSNTIGTPTHTTSWFGRANYGYKGKYLLTATFRADGSSKFGTNNHWGYFPAAAVAWRISDEAFMEGTKTWLDNLKLRISYGTSGADNISPSLWKSTWNTSTIVVDGETITTFTPGDMKENPNLKWETTHSRNIGLDFGFLDNRIRGSFDAYWNTTKDILMKTPIDTSSGYSYQFQNVGQTSNKGFELALSADLVHSKNFNLTLNVNYNYNTNNVDKLVEGVLVDEHNNWNSGMLQPFYDYVIREGQPVGLIQGFVSDGFYTVDDFDYDNTTKLYKLKPGVLDCSIGKYDGGSSLAVSGQNAFPGMAKFKNVNGDDVIDVDDIAIIGKTESKHSGGFTLSGNYKDLDFSAGFTYRIGGDIYNTNAMYSYMGGKDTNLGENRLSFLKDTYRIYDLDASGNLQLVTEPAQLKALNAGAKYALPYSQTGIVSSDFIEDASYLRFQNLTIGYSFPKAWINKIGLTRARIYFTGTNLFCLNSYSGLDPDVNTKALGDEGGFPTPNYDFNSYPKARTYTFGINLSF